MKAAWKAVFSEYTPALETTGDADPLKLTSYVMNAAEKETPRQIVQSADDTLRCLCTGIQKSDQKHTKRRPTAVHVGPTDGPGRGPTVCIRNS